MFRRLCLPILVGSLQPLNIYGFKFRTDAKFFNGQLGSFRLEGVLYLASCNNDLTIYCKLISSQNWSGDYAVQERGSINTHDLLLKHFVLEPPAT